MAFPVVYDEDTTSGVQTSNSTSWTCSYPTNLFDGCLILLVIATDGGTGIGALTGWVDDTSGAATAVSVSYAKKLSDGSESGTFSVPINASEQGAWACYKIGLWGGTIGTTWPAVQGTSGDAAVQGSSGSGSSNPDPPSCDPTFTGDILWLAVAAADTSRTFSAYPFAGGGNVPANGYLASGGSTGATLAWSWKEENIAAQDPGTFTMSASDDWAAATIAIAPGTSGTPLVVNPNTIVVPKIYPPQVIQQRSRW